MPDNKLITVFTPAYNRAHLLSKLYNSLTEQNFTSFEWLVVDDGSTDNTTEVIREYIEENKIAIRYFHQNNSGKHIAINKGVSEAKSTLFFIVDSDDYLLPGALSDIYEAWSNLPKEKLERCAGISGLRVHPDGKIIGGEVDYSVLDMDTITYRFSLKIQGDKAEAYRTDLLKMFPFPQFEGEKFCPEALIWNRVAKTYFLRHINKPLYVCEYLNEGLTSQIIKVRVNSPKSSLLYYSELANNNRISFAERVKAVVNFWRFSFYDTTTFHFKRNQVKHKWAIFFYPLALLFFLKEKELKDNL